MKNIHSSKAVLFSLPLCLTRANHKDQHNVIYDNFIHKQTRMSNQVDFPIYLRVLFSPRARDLHSFTSFHPKQTSRAAANEKTHRTIK